MEDQGHFVNLLLKRLGAVQRMAFYFLLFVHHIEDETQTRSMVRALTWNKVGSHKYIVDVPVLPGLEHTKSRRGIEPSH